MPKMDCQTYRDHWTREWGRVHPYLHPDVDEEDPVIEQWVRHDHDCRECGDWSMRQRVREWGGDPKEHPCPHLAYYSTHNPRCCERFGDHAADDCSDVLITRNTHRGEYGISVKDGGGSHVTIRFCPWCGIELHTCAYDELIPLEEDE